MSIANLTDYLPSLKVGSNNCPYCGRPSFSYHAKGLGWCFSTKCPSHGKVIDIIHHYRWINNLWGKGSFYRALEDLEEKYGLITINERIDAKASLLEEVMKVYQSSLYGGEGVHALNYLIGRGWSDITIKKVGIGYAPNPHTLLRYGLDASALSALGLHSDGRDYFSKRVVFPIRDIRGKVIHITGRYLYNIPVGDNGDPLFPKWKHTKGVGLTSISHYLVGEENISSYRESPRGSVYLTEGYPDTLTLYNIGLPALGTLGLQGLLHHTHKLEGLSEVTCMYDCDTFPDDHPNYPGEYKSWRVVIPQLIELQTLLPSVDIYICMVPSEGYHCITGVPFTCKDINEFCVGTGANGRYFSQMVRERRVLLVEYLIGKYGQDLSWHRKLTQLVVSTGKGKELLESYIPRSITPLEYALLIWRA
jgi:DNA primase catalytic core, N-terminal domain